MFADANLARSQEGANLRDDDGAKRVFFGGERFLEGISGEAHVMHRYIFSFQKMHKIHFFTYLDKFVFIINRSWCMGELFSFWVSGTLYL